MKGRQTHTDDPDERTAVRNTKVTLRPMYPSSSGRCVLKSHTIARCTLTVTAAARRKLRLGSIFVRNHPIMGVSVRFP